MLRMLWRVWKWSKSVVPSRDPACPPTWPPANLFLTPEMTYPKSDTRGHEGTTWPTEARGGGGVHQPLRKGENPCKQRSGRAWGASTSPKGFWRPHNPFPKGGTPKYLFGKQLLSTTVFRGPTRTQQLAGGLAQDHLGPFWPGAHFGPRPFVGP